MLGSGLAVLEAALLAASAGADGTLWLPGRDIGLLEHTAIAAVVLADFFVVVIVAATVQLFLRVPKRLPLTAQGSNRRYLRRTIGRGQRAIALNSRSRSLLLFGMGVGFLFWLANVIQTRDPFHYYGADVFDSFHHRYGYVSGRLVLGVSWIFIYPYVFLMTATVGGGLFVATRTLYRHRRLKYRLFHPDQCGGFAIIGQISFMLIMATLILYVALVIVIVTFRKLSFTQLSGFCLLSMYFLWLTFSISWPTIAFLRRAKRSLLLSGYAATSRRSGWEAIAALQWTSTVASFSPYSTYQKVAINLSRLAPFTIALARFWVHP